jgi:hypothetical protein
MIARAMILEAARDHGHAVGQQRSGEGLPRLRGIALAIEGEAHRLSAHGSTARPSAHRHDGMAHAVAAQFQPAPAAQGVAPDLVSSPRGLVRA